MRLSPPKINRITLRHRLYPESKKQRHFLHRLLSWINRNFGLNTTRRKKQHKDALLLLKPSLAPDVALHSEYPMFAQSKSSDRNVSKKPSSVLHR